MRTSKLLLTFIIALTALTSFGKGREYIRQQIKDRGECRNVAITETNGNLMLYGKNGYAVSGCPTDLVDKLKELNDAKHYIDDVQLTEGGRWLIIWDDNGCSWNDIPYSLEQKIREFNDNHEVITSVTFNDAGQWIVITTQHYVSSDGWIQDWLKEKADKYGMLWAACLTNKAMVAVYEEGYGTYGDIPTSLSDALKNTKLDVYRLKVAGTAWFFADKNGSYQYNM